jgi:hypothetical protein
MEEPAATCLAIPVLGDIQRIKGGQQVSAVVGCNWRSFHGGPAGIEVLAIARSANDKELTTF